MVINILNTSPLPTSLMFSPLLLLILLIIVLIFIVKNAVPHNNITNTMPIFGSSIKVVIHNLLMFIGDSAKSTLSRPVTNLRAFFFRVINTSNSKNPKNDLYKLILCTGCGHSFDVVAGMPAIKVICPECLKPWLQ